MPDDTPTLFERIWYWPMGKEAWQSPKVRAWRALSGMLGVTFFALLSGVFFTFGITTGDSQGLLFIYSNTYARYEDFVGGVLCLMLALAIGIFRFVLSPMIEDRGASTGKVG